MKPDESWTVSKRSNRLGKVTEVGDASVREDSVDNCASIFILKKQNKNVHLQEQLFVSLVKSGMIVDEDIVDLKTSKPPPKLEFQNYHT